MHCFEMGGAQGWLAALAQHTDPQRIEWTGLAVVHGRWTDPQLGFEAARIMPVHEGPPGAYCPYDSLEFVRQHTSAQSAVDAACEGADVIITWGVANLKELTAGIARPVVLVAQNESPWEAAQVGSSESGATHFVAVSESCVSVFAQSIRGRVAVIHNAAVPERCLPRLGREWQRRAWNVADNEKLIGYVGRLVPDKNPLAAAYAVAALGKGYRAVYVGSGYGAVQIRERAERIAPGRCLFLPPVSHVGDLLAALDVFLLGSAWEGSSLGVFEAWMANTPTVCTPVGAMPELQAQYGPLTVVVPKDATPEELAEGVTRAVAPSNHATVERAHRLACARFTASVMADRWTQYIESVVESWQQRKRDSL